MSDPIPAEVLMHAPPLSDDELESVFAADGTPDEAVPEPVRRGRTWEPETQQEAEWCMAKAAAAGRAMDEIATQAAEYHEQIDAWAHDASRSARSTSAFFRQKLEGYLRRRYDADPKLRTLKLPSGTLRVTVPKSGTVVVVDEEALLRWVLANGEKVPPEQVINRPDPKVYISELRKYVKPVPLEDGSWSAVVADHPETGAPPGVKVVPPADPNFTVNPA